MQAVKQAGMISLAAALLLGFVLNAGAWAQQAAIQPDRQAKCPVCGMFVYKYPDFLAELIFADGSVVFFDGVKDMLKFYHNLAKYRPEKKRADIAAIYVTDYYSLTLVDGRTCHYVVGSDVYGPMGKELIPFGNKAEAEQFSQDHKGRMLLVFDAIDAAQLKELD